MKYPAALLIVSWLVCWVHCFAVSSAGMNGDGCCGNDCAVLEKSADPSASPSPDALRADCVPHIFGKGVGLTSKPVVPQVVPVELPAGCFVAARIPGAKPAQLVAKPPPDPVAGFRLWEFMARTSLPVRGPACVVA